jgi:hypothetical protein
MTICFCLVNNHAPPAIVGMLIVYLQSIYDSPVQLCFGSSAAILISLLDLMHVETWFSLMIIIQLRFKHCMHKQIYDMLFCAVLFCEVWFAVYHVIARSCGALSSLV